MTCTFGMWLTTPQLHAQGMTAFTYQGQLRDGDTNANGAYTMIFKLYDALTSGNQIGTAITNSPILFNGLFTVNLDFGPGAFNGSARWLDITVSNGVAQVLSPRVQVLPAPYAQFAAVAATVTNGAIMNAQLAANAVATTNIQNGAITTTQIANGAVTNANITANAVNATNIASDQVVKTFDGLADNVILSAGANATLFTNGNALQISAVVPHIQVVGPTNTTFVVPTNVNRIMVEMWGGGGGGGGSVGYTNGGTTYYYPGGGGGAGGYGWNVFDVTAGASYSVVAGAKGGPGSAGGTSSFGGLISASGGSPGGNGYGAYGIGGAGGTSSGGFFSPGGNEGQSGGGNGGGNGGAVWRGGHVGSGGGGFPAGGGHGASGNPGGGSGVEGYIGLVIIYY